MTTITQPRWFPAGGGGGLARHGLGGGIDASTEIRLDLMEYCDQLSNSPLSYGGVPMVRYVTPGGEIRSHTAGQALIDW